MTEADNGVGSPSTSPKSHDAEVVEHALPTHDVFATEALLSGKTALSEAVAGPEAMNLEHALTQSVSSGFTVAKVVDDVLPPDKELVGALDSACNRTCAGRDWLRGYLQYLKGSPQYVQDLVQMHEENENFRFGNNGVVPSMQRWRLPAMIGQTMILFWVSLVPVSRDVLESIGAILDFACRALTCAHLASSTQHLKQMMAGHFFLELLPRAQAWRARSQSGKWRLCGQDGVVELWMQWFHFKAQQPAIPTAKEHEHLLVELSLKACYFTTASRVAVSMHENDNRSSTLPASSLAPVDQARVRGGKPHRVNARRRARQASSAAMEPPCRSHARSPRMARSWCSSLGVAATALAILALSLSQCRGCARLEAADGFHEGSKDMACTSLGSGKGTSGCPNGLLSSTTAADPPDAHMIEEEDAMDRAAREMGCAREEAIELNAHHMALIAEENMKGWADTEGLTMRELM